MRLIQAVHSIGADAAQVAVNAGLKEYRGAVLSKKGVSIARNARNKVSPGVKKILKRMSDIGNMRIVVENFAEGDNARGFYENGVVHLNAKKLTSDYCAVVAIHEAVHHVKAQNEAGYKVLEKYVREYLKLEGKDVDALVSEITANRKAHGEELTPEGAMEELVADTLSGIASDKNAMEAFLGLSEKEKSTLRRVLESLAERIKTFADTLTGAESRILVENSDHLLNLAKELNKALKTAGKNAKTKGVQNTKNKYYYNSSKDIDSDSDLSDNEHINNGGAVNGSQNTELLEKGTVSALSGRYDPVWKQSESARKILGYLGVLREGKTKNERSTGTSDSRWLEKNSYKQQIDNGFKNGVLRDLRGVTLSGKDTLGRVLNKSTLDKLKDTILKDKNGNIIPLYHWTPNVFNKFKYGDIGFHSGTAESAHDRYVWKKKENAENGIDTPIGIYKEVYYNISNPIFMVDLGQWTAYNVAMYLEINGYISETQYDSLSITEGFDKLSYDNPAITAVRQILSNIGYDGILYYNQSEDVGSVSAIALYPEQIIMVTDNGIPVKNDVEDTVLADSEKKRYSFGDEEVDLWGLIEPEEAELSEASERMQGFIETASVILDKTRSVELKEGDVRQIVGSVLRKYTNRFNTEYATRIELILDVAQKNPNYPAEFSP